jgi:hypothetical protein
VLGNITDGPLDADIIQGGVSMTDYQFKEAVDEEEEQCPRFDGIVRTAVGPDVHEFMEEVDEVVMEAHMINKWEGEARLFLFCAGEDKLNGETGHEAVRPSGGGSDMARREAEEVTYGEVVGGAVDGVTG